MYGRRYGNSRLDAGTGSVVVNADGTVSITGATDLSSTLSVIGNVGIGGTHTAAELLHVKEGSGTTPSPDGPTVAIFQRNPGSSHDCGVALVCGTSGTAALTFGDSDDDNRGGVLYAQSSDTMSFRVAAATWASLTSGDFTVATTSVKFTNLPTSDPSVAGQLWRSTNDVKISTG
jgi:hypothetical protein